jgi:hypothetical protein
MIFGNGEEVCLLVVELVEFNLEHRDLLFIDSIGDFSRTSKNEQLHGNLDCAGFRGPDLVGGDGLRRRLPREQVAAKSCDADRGYHRAPGSEEEPSSIGEKRVSEGHGG